MDCGYDGLISIPGKPPLFDRSGAVIVKNRLDACPLRKLTPVATTAGRAVGSALGSVDDGGNLLPVVAEVAG